MKYDIRNENLALKTLERLTGVDYVVWENEIYRHSNQIDNSSIDEDIIRTISANNGHFPDLKEIYAIVVHITTSANGCHSIRENGLIDLKGAYNNPQSELRQFLSRNGISIFLNDRILQYKGMNYDITHTTRHVDSESPDYKPWCVGRKFYYDYSVCGFFSINPRRVYGGDVHRRPEILYDLDILLDTDLQNLWMQNHRAYEIVFSVPLADTLYSGFGENKREIVSTYLYYAFETALYGPDTKEVICKTGVEIAPESIMEINEFTSWR